MVLPHEGQMGGRHSPAQLHLGHHRPPGRERAARRVLGQPPPGAAPGGDHLAARPGVRAHHFVAVLAAQPVGLRRRGTGLGPLPARTHRGPATGPRRLLQGHRRLPGFGAAHPRAPGRVGGPRHGGPGRVPRLVGADRQPAPGGGPGRTRRRARQGRAGPRAALGTGGHAVARSGAVSDRIEILDLRVTGTHGVLPEERDRAQPFSVDILAWVDMAAAQESDDLADTVDYGALAQTAADVVAGRSYRLLEALSGRLASALLIVDPRLEAVEVTVRKLRPPLALDVGSTGVRVRRAR